METPPELICAIRAAVANLEFGWERAAGQRFLVARQGPGQSGVSRAATAGALELHKELAPGARPDQPDAQSERTLASYDLLAKSLQTLSGATGAEIAARNYRFDLAELPIDRVRSEGAGFLEFAAEC